MTCLGPPQLRRPRSNLLITPFTNRLNNYFKRKGPPLNFIVSQEINKIPQLMQTKNSITVLRKISPLLSMLSIAVVARSKGWVWCSSFVGIAGFHFHRIHGCLYLVIVVCCQVQRYLRRADNSSTGVLPIVMCLNEIVKSRK